MNNKYEYKQVATITQRQGNKVIGRIPVYRASFKETRYTGAKLRELRAERGVGPFKRIKA